MKYTIKELPIFASSQTFQLNAMAIAPPGEKKPLIIFEDETFTYCHLLSKVITNCLGESYSSMSIDEEPVRKHLDKHPEIEDKFGELLHVSISKNSIVNVKPFPIFNLDMKMLLRIITDSMEKYLMGHELGHVIDGHLEINTEMSAIGDHSNEINPDWDKEFIADRIGLEIAIEAQSKSGTHSNYHLIGADTLMTFLHLQHVLKATIKGEKDLVYSLNSSHPPPMLRREKMREHYFNITGNQVGVNIAGNGSKILFELWDRIKEKVLTLNKGKESL